MKGSGKEMSKNEKKERIIKAEKRLVVILVCICLYSILGVIYTLVKGGNLLIDSPIILLICTLILLFSPVKKLKK